MSVIKNNEGFTIVEFVTTLVLLGIFAISISTMVRTNSRISARVRDQAVVNHYVENKVEELRSVGFLGLSNGTSNISSDLPNELASPKNGSITISDHSSGLKLAVVTVTYTSQGESKTTTYRTYVGELGVGQY